MLYLSITWYQCSSCVTVVNDSSAYTWKHMHDYGKSIDSASITLHVSIIKWQHCATGGSSSTFMQIYRVYFRGPFCACFYRRVYILNPFLMSLVFCMCIQHTYVCILIQWKCHLIASNSTAVVVFGPPADQSNLCACALTLLIHPLTAAYNTHKPRNLNAIYRSRSAYCANSHAALTRCCCSHALCCAASTSVCGFNFVHASHPRIASF